MARIRSIKPEFWTDGSNLELSDACALFFIGLWNFCDDEGKHRIDLKQVAAELGGRWHIGKVKLFISCLVNSGQLRINSDTTWMQVTGWSHQKIDRPKQPDVKAQDLQWLDKDASANALESSRLFGARIGSDRRDRIGSDQGERSSKVAKPRGSRKPKVSNIVPLDSLSPSAQAPDVQSVISLYCTTWKSRYGAYPPVKGKPSGQIKQLVKDYGAQKAGDFIAAYLDMPDQWFVTKRHDISTLLLNLNAIVQFIETGRMITRKEAVNADASSALKNQLDRVEKGEL